MATTTTYRVETVQPEFRVNSVTTGHQNLSNVIGLSNGGYAVVYRSESGGDEVVPRLEIYSSATDTTPLTVNVTDGGNTDMVGEPVITELSNGTIAVTWKEGPAGDNKVVTTTVNATTGVVVAREIQTGGHPSNTDPEVVALAGGRFAVVTDTGAGVNVFTFASDGGSPTGVFYSGIADPAVARLADGRFVVTYTVGGDVKARIFGANGVEVNGVGEINVGSAGASAPQVAALKNGGFAVVFQDATFDGTAEPGIGLRTFTSTGVAGSLIRVDNLNPANVDLDPEITVLANGFIVVSYTLQGANTDVVARIFDQNGDSISVDGWGSAAFPIDNAVANERQTSVAALLNGQFVTTWTDTAPGDSSGTGISARILELVRTQIGDGDGDYFTSDELRDEIYAGAGDDHLTVGSPPVSGEIFDGGTGRDTLNWQTFLIEKPTTADFRRAEVSNMETLEFSFQHSGSETRMLFTAAQAVQFDTFQFLEGATAAGSQGQAVEVTMGTSSAFSLSGAVVQASGPGGIVPAGPKAIFRIFGDGDRETITGSRIADTIDAGGGNDTLNGWLGRDTLRGGLGNDTYVLGSEASGIDAVQDIGGIDTITSTITRSLAFSDFSEIEKLTLLGKANIAGTGNRLANTITGNTGRNTLDGGLGNDTINGGAGNDTIIGNAGRDVLTGGLGNDIFKFTNKAHSRGSLTDIITDFDDRGRGNDRIDVSALFGPKMKYIHDDAFTKAGQVRIKDIAGPDVIVEVNTGGSLAADFSIRLKATTLASMTASDFIL